jgi:hypothetical protein
VRGHSVWKQLIGVDDRTVIEDINFEDDDQAVVVRVRRRRPKKGRCGHCERVSAGYDNGDGCEDPHFHGMQFVINLFTQAARDPQPERFLERAQEHCRGLDSRQSTSRSCVGFLVGGARDRLAGRRAGVCSRDLRRRAMDRRGARVPRAGPRRPGVLRRTLEPRARPGHRAAVDWLRHAHDEWDPPGRTAQLPAASALVSRRSGDRVTFLTVIVATGAEGDADARLVERPDGGHSVAVTVDGRDAVVDIGEGGALTLRS